VTDGAPRVRLRQAVLVAAELEPVAKALREALGLGEPFRDPGVAEFGLHNAVFAIGDCFIEVISPTRPGTPAGRYLERHGDGGYMVMFDLEGLAGARGRAAEVGVRVAWQIDLPDISGTHLHPADMRGAIVSLDESRPYGSWRWGGPKWTGRIADDGAPGRLTGVAVTVADPAGTAARWATVLGAPVTHGSQTVVVLDRGEVRFLPIADQRAEGLVELLIVDAPALEVAGGAVTVGGVCVVSRE
jgi:hypothetical protein